MNASKKRSYETAPQHKSSKKFCSKLDKLREIVTEINESLDETIRMLTLTAKVDHLKEENEQLRKKLLELAQRNVF